MSLASEVVYHIGNRIKLVLDVAQCRASPLKFLYEAYGAQSYAGSRSTQQYLFFWRKLFL